MHVGLDKGQSQKMERQSGKMGQQGGSTCFLFYNKTFKKNLQQSPDIL